jgi:hypothetical protein
MDELEEILGQLSLGADAPAPATSGLTMPWATVISNLATAGVSAYEAHEQSDASKRQAKLQQTSQEGDRGLRDYALDMRKRADEARARADQYRQATAGKGMAFGAAYKNLDDTARALDRAASEAEARAGLRSVASSSSALTTALQAPYLAHDRASWLRKNATLVIGGAAILMVGGGLVWLIRRKRK